MKFFGKKGQRDQVSSNGASDRSLTAEKLSESQIIRATRTRKGFGWLSSFCLFVSVIFLIIVEIGNTSDKAVLRNIWFIKLDLTNVVPVSVPNSALLNSIAQSIGLHDFYQVGLWNYCEGYTSTGVSDCTKPETLYWFNPVQIISSQLIAGASIQLPPEISSVLDIIHIASNWMFGLFLTGACLSFVLMFFMPLVVYSRWVAFLYTIVTFFNALSITAAAVIATVMFVIMKNVFESNSDVNIGASLGTTMFACMWIAAAFSIFTFLFQFGMCCCCASRRDVRTGRKRGNKKAYAARGSLEK